MEDQQRLNSLLNEINVYRQQADLIQQQIELIQASIAEVDAFLSTLDDIEGQDSIEAFVPVGAGTFVKGELKDTDEIIVSIGAGMAIKKDAEGAREIMERQKEELIFLFYLGICFARRYCRFKNFDESQFHKSKRSDSLCVCRI